MQANTQVIVYLFFVGLPGTFLFSLSDVIVVNKDFPCVEITVGASSSQHPLN